MVISSTATGDASAPPLTSGSLRDPVRLLNGLPFLDDGFDHRRLLAGVAAIRHVEAARAGRGHGRHPAAWLAPAAVYMLRGESTVPALPLTPVRRAAVDDQVERIAATVPPWRPLVRLPVRYALLAASGGAISASSRAWQQHVLLAEAAFATAGELREQIVHEMCHQWLYLIQELWALQNPGAATITLPSGTGGRTPAEALGAAHVAASLIRLYRSTADQPATRIGHLARYATGCLRRADNLTDAGARISGHLSQHLKEVL